MQRMALVQDHAEVFVGSGGVLGQQRGYAPLPHSDVFCSPESRASPSQRFGDGFGGQSNSESGCCCRNSVVGVG